MMSLQKVVMTLKKGMPIFFNCEKEKIFVFSGMAPVLDLEFLRRLLRWHPTMDEILTLMLFDKKTAHGDRSCLE